MASITDTLTGLGIMTRFDVIASGQDVQRPKPAPDVYQLALERLELAPDEAIAVEDSRVGLTAAASAGLRCIAVPGPLTSSQDFSEAFLRFPSLVEVAAWLDEHVSQPA
jgi:putative hydrolase of the HAD superfamily